MKSQNVISNLMLRERFKLSSSAPVHAITFQRIALVLSLLDPALTFLASAANFIPLTNPSYPWTVS